MDGSLVLHHVAVSGEAGHTLWTLEKLLSVVGLLVSLQGIGSGIHLVALRARELLAGMALLVSNQASLLCKLFSTGLAYKRHLG